MLGAATSQSSTASPAAPGRWLLEWEVWALAALVTVVYCGRTARLPIQGEETRRGVIAREMLETGDWIAPRVQGVVRLSRPPLQNWLIAGCSVLTGEVDVLAVRLPSIAATVLTVLLIYGVGRQYLSRTAAAAAGAAYATMFLVLEYGRSGETEAVFTLFVSASLLLWWHGRQSGWSSWLVWTAGFACAALAMLTKGLQAPLCFVAITGCYIIGTGAWREFLCPGYWFGVLTGLLIVAGWQIPFVLETSLAEGWQIYFSNVAHRFSERHWLPILAHLLGFPLEVVCGTMAPWSILLLSYASGRFRTSLGSLRPHARYLSLCCGVAFLFVWLPPGSRTRYYLPLFPCCALLIGIVFEQGLQHGDELVRGLWRAFRVVLCTVAGATGTAVAVIAVALPQSPFAVSRFEAVLYGGLCGLTCWLLLPRRQCPAWLTVRAELWSSATFLGLAFSGPWLSIQANRSEDVAASVAALKRDLPEGCRLVSLGELMHTFLFHYQARIELLPPPGPDASLPAGIEYFAIHTYDTAPPKLPFAWEPVRLISCDRFRRTTPRDRIYVGRRLIVMASRDSERGR